MRLPNGYGSVYKLSGNRRRPYIAVVTKECLHGKQIRVPIGYYTSQPDALEALASFKKHPVDLSARNYTYERLYTIYTQNRWISKGEDIPHNYTAAFNRSEKLWPLVFSEIRTDDMQEVVDACPLGYSSKKNIKILLNLISKFALSKDMISKNYAEFIKLPELVQSRKHSPFTPTELKKLWDNTDDPRVATILIMTYTGFRPTELMKVRTENVHLDEQYMTGGMKTAAGTNRIVPIANKILPFVKYFYNPEQEYLLQDQDGPYTYDNYRNRVWEPVMRKLQMVHLPHDCRHTCATLLDDAGINTNITKKILGHSGSNITEKVYIHKRFVQLLDAINTL